VSITALNWAFDQDVRPAGRKFVLVALANFADEDATCFPGQRLIAKMTGQSIRAARAHIEVLENAGLISRESRRRADGSLTSDRFRLALPGRRLAFSNHRQDLPEADSAAGKECGNQRQTLPEPPARSAAHDPKEIRQKDPKRRSPSVRSEVERATNNSRNQEQRRGRRPTERERRFYEHEELLADERAKAPTAIREILASLSTLRG